LRDGVDVSNSRLGPEPRRAGNYARINSYKRGGLFCELMIPRQGLRTSLLQRTIQREVLAPLSIDILEGKVRERQTVHVNAKDGAFSFRA